MATRGREWLRSWAVDLAALVEDRGLLLSIDAAETFLAERHHEVAQQLGVSERAARQFLDAGTLADLADQLVSGFAVEEPGADIFSLPRTARATVGEYGRFIAGLAEAAQLYVSQPGIDEGDREGRIREVAEMLSAAGLMQADADDAAITAPPALFHRIARVLGTVAELTDDPDLAAAMGSDGARASAIAAAGGTVAAVRGID